MFGFDQAAEDEAFGVNWSSLDGIAGEKLWRELLAEVAPASPADALGAIARCWGLELGSLAIDKVDAAERIVAVGPTAIARLAEAFVGRSDLDWTAQVQLG